MMSKTVLIADDAYDKLKHYFKEDRVLQYDRLKI